MHISRVQIKNFRNFSDVDVEMGKNAVIVGENGIGKVKFYLCDQIDFRPIFAGLQQTTTSGRFLGRHCTTIKIRRSHRNINRHC